jgi:cobyrinic acid a,c-diamide synthase
MVKVVVIAGTHSGVGKTSLSVGLMLALRQQGLTVQPFKVSHTQLVATATPGAACQ